MKTIAETNNSANSSKNVVLTDDSGKKGAKNESTQYPDIAEWRSLVALST